MKRRIIIVTGSRSEYGILKSVIKQIFCSKKLKPILVVAGMHLSKKHGLSINDILRDGYKVNYKVKMIPKGNSHYGMVKSLGTGIIKFGDIFKKINPELVLVLGDRDEIFAAAIAASHMNIPIAHIHGGDKTKAGIDEYNRHAITKISNIHFSTTQKSFQRIIKLGENPKFVFNTGSPSIDDIKSKYFSNKNELEKKYKIKFSGKDILLVFHPVTTEIENSVNTFKIILNVIEKLKRTTIAIGPNSDAGNKQIFEELKKFSNRNKFFKFYTNVPRYDFLGFLNNCSVLIGNSSSGMIEAGYFDIKVINIGNRQDQREHGANVVTINISKSILAKELGNSLKTRKSYKKLNVYGDGNAAKKIVNILETISINKELIQKQIAY